VTTFHGRRAASIENSKLRVTVLQEGGHIAEILDKDTGINPLWVPPWPSIEPSKFTKRAQRVYGADVESRLLSGIMGHNLCLDIFGGPSDAEFAAGIGVHGEASVAPYKISKRGATLVMRTRLPLAQINFERRIELRASTVRVRESVTNLAAFDRPIGWTQHATLGPPFLERGATQFRATATRSMVFGASFGAGDYLRAGAEFDWPHAPRADGGTADLRVMNGTARSCAYTAHLMDPARAEAFFIAYSPAARLAFGYAWKRADFPWLGIWEENHSRTHAPWNGNTLTRGMEFGVSPIPESRRQMVERGGLFGVPGYRWLPAKGRLEAEYRAVILRTDRIPDSI
jgi:hypothetical protein